jgi:TetR/AcrR family transcriptional regulator
VEEERVRTKKRAVPAEGKRRRTVDPQNRLRGRPKKIGDVDERITRELILTSALALFSNSGYSGASFVDIARACNVSAPLIHYYFKDKEALWKAAVDFGFGDMMTQLRLTLHDLKDLDSLARLKFLIRRYVNLWVDKPSLFLIITHESEKPGAHYSWMTQTHLEPFYASFSRFVEEAQNDGRIMANVPVYHLSQIIVGACYHFLASRRRMLTVYGIDPCSPENSERHADLVVEILMHGMQIGHRNVDPA